MVLVDAQLRSDARGVCPAIARDGGKGVCQPRVLRSGFHACDPHVPPERDGGDAVGRLPTAHSERRPRKPDHELVHLHPEGAGRQEVTSLVQHD
jgi:hypothetical protein